MVRKGRAEKILRDAEFMMGNIFQNGWCKASPKRALCTGLKKRPNKVLPTQFMTGFLLSGEIDDEPEAVKGYAWTEVSRVNGYGGAQEVLEQLV